MSKRANVNKIIEAMNWNQPKRVESGVNGYILKFAFNDDPVRKRFDNCLTYYKNYEEYIPAMKIISKEIFEKTGITCTVTSGGNLQVPYADAKKVI